MFVQSHSHLALLQYLRCRPYSRACGRMEVSMAEKEMKLEESFEKLNLILEELEKPEVTLEDSFALYQEGMKLLKS